MSNTTNFSDIVYKFSVKTNADPIQSSTTPNLGDPDQVGIDFTFQIVEKGNQLSTSTDFESSIVNSTKINTSLSQDLANVIAVYFVEKQILSNATDSSGTGRNIRSMKLIINVDENA